MPIINAFPEGGGGESVPEGTLYLYAGKPNTSSIETISNYVTVQIEPTLTLTKSTNKITITLKSGKNSNSAPGFRYMYLDAIELAKDGIVAFNSGSDTINLSKGDAIRASVLSYYGKATSSSTVSSSNYYIYVEYRTNGNWSTYSTTITSAQERILTAIVTFS